VEGGPGVWGDPKDPDEAVRVLRRAVELGVNLIDTADAYGPFVAEQLIAKALSQYNDDLVIATKAGFTRAGPGDWRPVGRPEYLRQQTELSLRHLGLERIPLQQLHRIGPLVPLADQLGEFKLLRDEGKIDLIGLSEISVEDLAAAQEIVEISSVQNLYNVANRQSEPVSRRVPRRASRSYRGSRSPPAHSPSRVARWPPSLVSTASHHHNSRSPGYCIVHR
jgi:pyridoxine 4-dehydrogenase